MQFEASACLSVRSVNPSQLGHELGDHGAGVDGLEDAPLPRVGHHELGWGGGKEGGEGKGEVITRGAFGSVWTHWYLYNIGSRGWQ